MNITPDQIIFFKFGFFSLNATIVFSWLIMMILIAGSYLATRKLSSGPDISPWQNILESVVNYIRGQIKDVSQQKPWPYLPFIGTLYLFIAFANLLAFLPGYNPPTGSLSTTAALAICVFFAVPYFGIRQAGVKGYLSHYVRPVVFMLPFNIISEFSRTLALAVRLFGNMMSGTLIIAVLLTVAPLFVPVLMHLFNLLIGQIHAYIFAVLALVYIASASRKEETV